MPATPRKPERPKLWIIAGPNGSGKSSLYNRTDIEGWGGSVWIVNPDLLTARLREAEKLGEAGANGTALDRIATWLNASIEVHQTIGVETVLSSAKYRPLIDHARKRGFEVRMLYVVLDSVEMQIERIRIRVQDGGHDVPRDKIIARRQRSFEQLAWFLPRVDQCILFNNSGGEPELIGAGDGAVGFVRLNPMPRDLEDALVTDGIAITDIS